MGPTLIALAVLLPTMIQGSADDPVPSRVPVREHTADWQHLRTWFDLDKSASADRRTEGLRAIEDHLENRSELTDAEFYMELRRIVALADNGHSNVTDQPLFQEFGTLPLRAHWFSDGLHIVRARQDHGDLLGARITSIDGRSIEELEARLQDFQGGTAGFFRSYLGPGLLLCPAALHAVGLAEHADRLSIGVSTRNKQATVTQVPVDQSSGSVRGRPWQIISRAHLPGDGGWLHVLPKEQALPIYLQDPERTFRYELLRDGELAYIQFRANIGLGGESIQAFVTETRKRLEEDMPLSIILDNRQNGGGDLTTTAQLALALPDLAYEEGRVYVLTGPGTFSAGIYTSYFPKSADPERTRILGEPVGDRARFWAETSDLFVLPESGYAIGHSLELHDLAAGCFDKSQCHMARYRRAWNISVGELAVDWPIPTSFSEYAEGRDPHLERIWEE